MSTACRECHQEVAHKLSCSIAKYGDRRREVLPEDEVAPDHEPTTPYCPGPEVACRYADEIGLAGHRCPADTCYYRTEPL